MPEHSCLSAKCGGVKLPRTARYRPGWINKRTTLALRSCCRDGHLYSSPSLAIVRKSLGGILQTTSWGASATRSHWPLCTALCELHRSLALGYSSPECPDNHLLSAFDGAKARFPSSASGRSRALFLRNQSCLLQRQGFRLICDLLFTMLKTPGGDGRSPLTASDRTEADSSYSPRERELLLFGKRLAKL